MNRLKLLLLLVICVANSSSSNSSAISSLKNEDGTWNVTYNCSHEKEKEVTVGIWDSTFPDDIRALTIANCKNLNILTGQRREKRNFSELLVNNVDFCKITGEAGEKLESSLPGRSFFTNVKSLEIDAGLYRTARESGECFTNGILYFSNVTIENFITAAIRLERSSLKTFFMSGVRVKNASENAISFCGSRDSVLEIRNSVFDTVPNNFIKCNVTNVKIWRNKFGNLKQGSFHLNSENVDFTENTIERIEGYAFKISPNPYDSMRNNDFKGVTVDEALSHVSFLKLFQNKIENVEELDGGYFVQAPDEINVGKAGEKCYQPSKAKFVSQSTSYPETEGKAFLSLLGQNIPLLWFLSVTFLILLFPIAYFIKTYLCSSINEVFPLEMKHQRLINIDDT